MKKSNHVNPLHVAVESLVLVAVIICSFDAGTYSNSFPDPFSMLQLTSEHWSRFHKKLRLVLLELVRVTRPNLGLATRF